MFYFGLQTVKGASLKKKLLNASFFEDKLFESVFMLKKEVEEYIAVLLKFVAVDFFFFWL